MALGRAAVGGLIGGAIGAAIWAGICYGTHRQIGWVAWGVGGLVGLGVRIGAQEDDGPKFGFVAAGIAALALVCGKGGTALLLADDIRMDTSKIVITDESMIADYANEIVRDRQSKGKAVKFPAGKTSETVAKQADYPPDVWKEASKKWADLGKAGQEAKKAEERKQLDALVSNVRGAARQGIFQDLFTPFDLLWFGLAMFTAFRLGSGLVTDGD